MARSKLISSNEIKEFIKHIAPGLPDHKGCSDFWEEFITAEDELMTWWKNTMLVNLQGTNTQEKEWNIVLGAFLTGLWFGERRWATRMEDITKFDGCVDNPPKEE